MSSSHATLEAGLTTFSALLEAEYGQPIAHWAGLPEWGDREKRQLSRALELLILEPIADAESATPDAIAASEIGAKRIWALCDQKIAGAAFETTWQWRLLAEIDNATKGDDGQMMTPSDPRLFVLKLKYERDPFAALWERFASFLCDAALAPRIERKPPAASRALLPEACAGQAAALQQIPGLEAASPAFIAGLLFVLTQLGAKSFCDWALDLC
ncbi:hypothetical protein [Methylocapsa aurea]|uniref:hypothetical protein n=1 Tax=Methylocapsa aurea TaxID=663610 RepID=UPI00056CDE86|nr:hypothetical protein [Methylocapsa aurea]